MTSFANDDFGDLERYRIGPVESSDKKRNKVLREWTGRFRIAVDSREGAIALAGALSTYCSVSKRWRLLDLVVDDNLIEGQARERDLDANAADFTELVKDRLRLLPDVELLATVRRQTESNFKLT